MLRLFRLFLAIVVFLGGLPALPAGAESICDPDGQQSSGAIYRICMPGPGEWNGDLVIFAHGYVSPTEPVAIPDDQLTLPGGVTLPELVNNLGFAFATTSYRTNGLAVLQGVADIRDLVDIFRNTYGEPRYVYLTGGSEGGIITTLAVEQYPDVFDGGLAACGPIGDFRYQVNYWGDFRVIFDYFFPDLLPGDPTNVPQEVMDNWDTVYLPQIRDAIHDRPLATYQLLRVTRAPIDRSAPDSLDETVLGLMWYNVFATNDGIAKLGGQPFDNTTRIYRGSFHDLLLNLRVARFSADPAAVAEIETNYQTSGHLVSPLVTLHTTGDPIVPYWHEPLYRRKVKASGSEALHSNIPVLRYGHCNFTAAEVLVGFVLLVYKVTGQGLVGAERVLPDPESRAQYLDLARQYGVLR